MAHFWGWYILLRTPGAKGRLTCYWDQDPNGVGYNSPERLWEVADNMEQLDEQMRVRGYPLSVIPLELWHEDTRPDAEIRRLERALSQHYE
jgi:hypothetical protein